MITQETMFEPLLAACPSFQPTWEEFLKEWEDEEGEPPLYLALGDLARHVITLIEQGDAAAARRAFAVVESWHTEGDHFVSEAATIGFLEGLGNNKDDASITDAEIRWYLGPESERWWDKLAAYWAGNVTALQEDKHFEQLAPSKAQSLGCRSLRAALAPLEVGDHVEESEDFRWFLSSLEYLLPELLAQNYEFWTVESLDGVYPEIARKRGPLEVEILGLCILIKDQTLVPIHVRFAVEDDADVIRWIDCKLGETVEGTLARIPYDIDRLEEETRLAAQRASEIDWAFRASVGDPPRPRSEGGR